MMLLFSIDGSRIMTIRLAGAPRDASFRLISSTVTRETCVARGWGLKTTLLPAASIPMELQMIVSVGLVVGVMAPITPKGDSSVIVRPLSPLTASVVRSSVPGDFSAASRFLMSLCS